MKASGLRLWKCRVPRRRKRGEKKQYAYWIDVDGGYIGDDGVFYSRMGPWWDREEAKEALAGLKRTLTEEEL